MTEDLEHAGCLLVLPLVHETLGSHQDKVHRHSLRLIVCKWRVQLLNKFPVELKVPETPTLLLQLQIRSSHARDHQQFQEAVFDQSVEEFLAVD